MSKYKITNDKYINPYNFVSIHETVERGDVEYGVFSGTISCELETIMPLFIPNTTKDNVFSAEYSHSYDFYNYEDMNSERSNNNPNPARPIIPGSSIRGVIRAAFEAVTNSCMSTCDDENTLYRRTPVPRNMYGIIEKDESSGERVLYKASKWKWSVRDRATHKTGEVLRNGIYLRGEDFNGKKNDAIMKYEPNKDGEKTEIARFSEDSREWNNFLEVWRLYQKRGGKIKGVNQSTSHHGYPDYMKSARIPVYMTKLDNTDYYYIAPAAITKEVFSRTLSELLERQGGHNPCQNREKLCLACSLFGMVGENAQASRLFFHDATSVAEDNENADWSDWYESVRALPILSSPKVSATEFYMEDEEGSAYFNYDYTVNYYDYFDDRGRSASAPVRTFLDEPMLRGRKFYWHRNNVVLDNTQSNKNQRLEIRPVGKGKRFRFEIGFERLTQTDLETLLWTLTFGEYNATHAHKIGHAKPYGYGSVRIIKTDVAIIMIDDDLMINKNNSRVFECKKPKDSIALREYLKLTDFSIANDNVRYPVGDNGKSNNSTGVYQWFGINKEIRAGGFKPSFNYTLPKPLDQNIELHGYVVGNGYIGGNRIEIRNADVPEKQSDILLPKSTETKGTTIEDMLKQRESEKAANATPKYGIYKAADIKIWLNPYKRDAKTIKALDSFVSDYERAEAEDDKRYKDISHLYKSAKEKLSNG